MESRQLLAALPPIPAKRYFTIGEVSELCAVKPHVLRYWEQEFSQLRPMKRRGNRRYYQHHEVLLVRKIRDLLYDQGFTISGARNQLMEGRLNGASHAAAPALLAGVPGLVPGAYFVTGSDGVAGSLAGNALDSALALTLGGNSEHVAAGAAALSSAALRTATATATAKTTAASEAADAKMMRLRGDLEAVLQLLKPSPTRL